MVMRVLTLWNDNILKPWQIEQTSILLICLCLLHEGDDLLNICTHKEDKQSLDMHTGDKVDLLCRNKGCVCQTGNRACTVHFMNMQTQAFLTKCVKYCRKKMQIDSLAHNVIYRIVRHCMCILVQDNKMLRCGFMFDPGSYWIMAFRLLSSFVFHGKSQAEQRGYLKEC